MPEESTPRLTKSLASPLAVGPVVAIVAFLALILSGIALVRSAPGTSTGSGTSFQSALTVTRASKIIRAGYSGFQPYTIIDPERADSPTGFCVELLETIAARQDPPWRIEWHRVTFETLRADMTSRRFDVFADAVYQTIPRAADFVFTEPFGYFGVAVALVRKDDNRFTKFMDLDQEGVVIVLATGWTSTEFAQQHLKSADLKLVPVAEDPFVQLEEVRAGRADAALQDVPTVLQYANEHKGEVKALWLEAPPSMVPAGFMLRAGDEDFARFLSTSFDILRADGTVNALAKKWNAMNGFPVVEMVPGPGLRPSS